VKENKVHITVQGARKLNPHTSTAVCVTVLNSDEAVEKLSAVH
jgi:hypothetical protein